MFYKRKNKREGNPPRDYPSNVYRVLNKFEQLLFSEYNGVFKSLKNNKVPEEEFEDIKDDLKGAASKTIFGILYPLTDAEVFSESLRWVATLSYPTYILLDFVGRSPSGGYFLSLVSTIAAADLIYNRFKKRKIAKNADEVMKELNDLEGRLK